MPAIGLEPLPPQEAIAFFRAKGYRTTFDWRDAWQEEHTRAFTVAKAMRHDVLSVIRTEVDRAIAEGLTVEQFRKALEPRLAQMGWWGRRMMTDPATGVERLVQLGSPRRLRTIFDTNLRMAHAAGRWERIQRTAKRRPFLRYVSVLDGRTRPHHRAWHGTVLPVSDPWWKTHYPPNGWHCRCIVQQLSQRDLDRFGYRVSDAAPSDLPRRFRNPRTNETIRVPGGIDPGFAYNVGDAHMRGLTTPPRSGPPPVPVASPPAPAGPLPPPRPAPATRLLPPGLPDREYVDRFLSEFGASPGRPAVFTDVLGEPIVIDEALFLNAAGEIKVTKRGRERSLLLLADTIKRPDEVWWAWQEFPKGDFQLMRRYIAAWDVEGETQPMFALFDISKNGWSGVTGFRADRESYLRNQRRGTLAWRRTS